MEQRNHIYWKVKEHFLINFNITSRNSRPLEWTGFRNKIKIYSLKYFGKRKKILNIFWTRNLNFSTDIQRMTVIGRTEMTLGVWLHTSMKLKNMVKRLRVRSFLFAKTILVPASNIGNISKEGNWNAAIQSKKLKDFSFSCLKFWNPSYSFRLDLNSKMNILAQLISNRHFNMVIPSLLFSNQGKN